MRLINADSLKKTLKDWISDHWTDAFTGDDVGSEFADMIDHAETIKQSPIVHAHWVLIPQMKLFSHKRIVKCSHCGNFLDMDGVNAGRGDANYCPNCGAKMDEEEGK